MLTQHHTLLAEGASLQELFDFSVTFMENSKLNRTDDQIRTMYEYIDFEATRTKAKQKAIASLEAVFPDLKSKT